VPLETISIESAQLMADFVDALWISRSLITAVVAPCRGSRDGAGSRTPRIQTQTSERVKIIPLHLDMGKRQGVSARSALHRG
jgi:hypothetical protein